MTDYLTTGDILAIHNDQICRFGGLAGVRDRGLLEAAVFRPQSGYYADLIEEQPHCGKAFPRTTHSLTATSARPSPPLTHSFG